MFPTCKDSQKQVKNQKSTDKHSSFDGLILENIDLSDIYLAVPKMIISITASDKISVKMYGKFDWFDFYLQKVAISRSVKGFVDKNHEISNSEKSSKIDRFDYYP